jgi:hypothetical protein
MTRALPVESFDEFCAECGHDTELKQSPSSFQVFAVSFALISTWMTRPPSTADPFNAFSFEQSVPPKAP